MTFIDISDESAFFIDKSNSGFYVRIEGIEGRLIIPLVDLNMQLGGLVNAFNSYQSKL